MKRLPGSLVMGHEPLTRAVGELRPVKPTPSGAPRVLPPPPQACAGVAGGPTLGGDARAAQRVRSVGEGRLALSGNCGNWVSTSRSPRSKIPRAMPEATVPDVEDVSEDARERPDRARFLHRVDRDVSGAFVLVILAHERRRVVHFNVDNLATPFVMSIAGFRKRLVSSYSYPEP